MPYFFYNVQTHIIRNPKGMVVKMLDFTFFLNNILLGIGLAMDAFSVSLANGLNEASMKKRKLCLIAGVFAVFQAIMPLAGWLCVHTAKQYFSVFENLIPWIALILLCFIGGKMLIENIHSRNDNDSNEECASGGVCFTALLIQGVATSIDALSVGFTIAEYGFLEALLAALIIASVTFIICAMGVKIGKTAGTHLASKAGILGGIILIVIGIEIFVTGVF